MTGPLPAFLSPITVPASRLYQRVIQRRNARFNRGIGVQSIDRPVISVGNITTGGTGKTPMVMWIARQLLDAGHHPVIAMRGYKSHDGVSDEQMEYADQLPQVPVVANPNRTAALRQFLQVNPQFDCVILDDGFQHRQVHRDLDLVLIDSTADTFTDRLLPAGHLREPLENLDRADAVIITRARATHESDGSSVEGLVREYHGRLPLAVSRDTWSRVIVYNQHGCSEREVNWLVGKRVLTMLGIGNPRSVMSQLESHGAIAAANIPASDHERYDRARVTVARGLCTGCDAMVVTHKDWVKLRNLIDLSRWPVPIVVPRLEFAFVSGEQQLKDLVLARCGAAAARSAR